MTAALEGGEWSAARPGHTLPPGKTRYPFYRRLGGPQGRSGWAENLIPTGIRSQTIQPVVSRYTDWATQPTQTFGMCKKSAGNICWICKYTYYPICGAELAFFSYNYSNKGTLFFLDIPSVSFWAKNVAKGSFRKQ